MPRPGLLRPRHARIAVDRPRSAPSTRSTGHKGKFGHEFMEFEFRPDGRLRYANNSNYKHDTMIRKEARVSRAVIDEVKRIVEESEILKYVYTTNMLSLALC